MISLRAVYLAGVLIFLYLPIAVLAAYSFNASPLGASWERWGWDWYRQLASDPALIDATLNSLLVAVMAASLSTVIGTLGAVGLRFGRTRWRGQIMGLLGVTLMSPEIVMGVSLLVLFIALRLPLGFWTLLLGHVTFCLPFVTVTVLARIRDFDARLVEAARDLGATRGQALRRIMLPLTLPAIVAGWLLSFTLSLDDVVVSFFVTGPDFEVLPLRIYSMVRMGVKPEVNALATLMFAVSLTVVIVSQRLLQRHS